MMPIDLAHTDQQVRATAVAHDMARHYGARLTFVGVTPAEPTSVARTPKEFAEKLSAFAHASGDDAIATHVVQAHDPTVDMDRHLTDAVGELKADLVVMASHIPQKFGFASHGGRLATHTSASILLVRGT